MAEKLPKRSWQAALILFLKAEGMGMGAKIILRFIPAAYIPFGILNDVTGIGFIDDPLTIGFALYVLWRINKYRNPNKYT
ncbi:MAG: hypothetical protein ABIR37_00180 [Candidatus Saccharimonadales bacterium]